MVSTQPSRSLRPESYADRAKGMQPAKSRNAPIVQRPPQPSTSTIGASEIMNSTASKAIVSPDTEAPVPLTSQPSSAAPPLPAPTTTITNGDVNASPADSQSSAPRDEAVFTTNGAQKLALPTMNVWNRRMAQMAQNRTKSGQASSQPARPTPSPDTSLTPQNTPQAPVPSSSTSQDVSRASSTKATDGSGRHGEDDAFVVRPQARAPAADDIESWPEVGKALGSVGGQGDPESSAKMQEKGNREGEVAQGLTRKSASHLSKRCPLLRPSVP